MLVMIASPCVGNSFLVSGATAATIVMLGALHVRRMYDDKKLEEAREKGIEIEFRPDFKASFLELLPLRTISRVWGSMTNVRTEIYEYSKLLRNSQFTLLPFQPYKLVYAHMLAEVGRVSDSLKYCQAVLKSLKTARAPEVETWRNLASSLEERIKTHQQGGFSTNLAPAKLVGKLLNLFDSTASRVVGSPPSPATSTTAGSSEGNGHYNQSSGPRVSASQSTMAMSSLIPSDSMEPINEWSADGNRMTIHNRSASEPDFGRTPRQDHTDSSKDASSTNTHGKASVSFLVSGATAATIVMLGALHVCRMYDDKKEPLGDQQLDRSTFQIHSRVTNIELERSYYSRRRENIHDSGCQWIGGPTRSDPIRN